MVSVRLAHDQLAALDDAIANGWFPSRAEAIKQGLDVVIRHERARAFVDSVREGYERVPDTDDWIGEVGLELGAQAIENDRRDAARHAGREAS